jgi:Leucine-rich repeat (LRR) protein
LTELPESIGKLQSLHRLNVSHNSLRALYVGSLKKLVRLHANHNELTELPNILGCKSLEELDLSHNPIQTLPSDLPLQLMNLWNLRVDEAGT